MVMYYVILYRLPSRYFPLGKLLSRLRGRIVGRLLGAKCGRNVEIEGSVLFGRFLDTEIGNNVQINEQSRIRNVVIGDDVMIAPQVYILHSGHNHGQTGVPMRVQGDATYAPTVIEPDVWIGARSIILPGRLIGRGSIVAAGSVVTKDVEPYTIVAGNPARIVRRRKSCVALSEK